jgi:hypothetical protein
LAAGPVAELEADLFGALRGRENFAPSSSAETIGCEIPLIPEINFSKPLDKRDLMTILTSGTNSPFFRWQKISGQTPAPSLYIGHSWRGAK